MNILRLIKKNELFMNFEDKEINEIFDSIKGRIVRYSRGTIVVHGGEEAHEICIVLNGTLLKFSIKEDGSKEAQGTVEEGGMFGETECFLPVKTHKYSYVTADDCDLLFITGSTITAHSCENSVAHQKLLENLLAALAARIDGMSKDTEYLIIKSMRLKIAKLIYDTYLEQQNLNVELGMNRNEMADYLNVSRPSMSREMMRMRDEGMFEFRKDKIEIKNLDAIKSIVEK